MEHIGTAILHGFDYAVAGAPVIIADGLNGKNIRKVTIKKKHFKEVSIAGDIAAADSLIVLSHFKGHIVSGFGGAIKNLAMGCAPPEGKRAQHNARPFTIPEKCTGCASCMKVCPKDAITVKKKKSVIDQELCIGCFECMHACPEHAIDIDWETEIPQFMERMVEYAYGAVQGKEKKVGIHELPDPDHAGLRLFPVQRCTHGPGYRDPRIEGPGGNRCCQFRSREPAAGLSRIRFLLPTTTREGTSSRASMPRRTGTGRCSMQRRSGWGTVPTISSKSDFLKSRFFNFFHIFFNF